jgi:hypothetical protein
VQLPLRLLLPQPLPVLQQLEPPQREPQVQQLVEQLVEPPEVVVQVEVQVQEMVVRSQPSMPSTRNTSSVDVPAVMA